MLSAVKERKLQEGEVEFSEALLDERTKKTKAWHRGAAAVAQYTIPAQPFTCATFAQDVLEGRAQVSQPHEHKHQPLIFGPARLVGGNLTTERLPNMSIEEAGLREMEMIQERTKKMMEEVNSSWYKDNRMKTPGQEDEDDGNDTAQDKARAWDDWKDDNPRGAGNKKLTPCG